MGIFGGGSDPRTTATTAPQNTGLGPNKFALQMFGPNADLEQRQNSIGFNNPGLAAQLLKAAAKPAAPAAAPPAADGLGEFEKYGPFGWLFKMMAEQGRGSGGAADNSGP